MVDMMGDTESEVIRRNYLLEFNQDDLVFMPPHS